jgi:hypothetical protein
VRSDAQNGCSTLTPHLVGDAPLASAHLAICPELASQLRNFPQGLFGSHSVTESIARLIRIWPTASLSRPFLSVSAVPFRYECDYLSNTMPTLTLSMPYTIALGVCAFVYLIVYPVVVYLRDVNGKQHKNECGANSTLTKKAFEDTRICIPFQACLRFHSSSWPTAEHDPRI